MIINKFYEKLYKELINKLESDYILTLTRQKIEKQLIIL